MRTTPVTPNATDLRAVYDACNGTLTICRDGEGIAIITPDAYTNIGGFDRIIRSAGCKRVDEWWAPGYEPGQIGYEDGPDEIECYVREINPLELLRAAYATVKADSASSNDVEQWLDEYLSSRGMASVLHA